MKEINIAKVLVMLSFVLCLLRLDACIVLVKLDSDPRVLGYIFRLVWKKRVSR